MLRNGSALLGHRGLKMLLLPATLAALLLAAASARAEEQPAPPSGDAAKQDAPRGEPAPQLAISGFVDAYFASNANKPADHANFFPGVGTSAKRDNEFSVNLAEADFSMAPDPVGFKLALGFGTATDVVHAAEVTGVAASPEVWRNVVQASVQWETNVGRGLVLEGGLYPSHIGMEAFATKDNWNYTRSWLGELSPYYQTGIKAAYPLSTHWSAQLHLLNGWQVISDNNRGKSVGWQLAYGSDKLSASFNGIAGPELPNDNADIRTLGDFVAVYKARSSLSLGLSVDAARQQRPGADDATWWGTGLYLRAAPAQSRMAFAARAEYYEDKDGAISGVPQILKEVTATVEHRPAEPLILKLEGRYDRSSAGAFTGDRVDTSGSPLHENDEFVILLSAVSTFAR